MDVAGGRGALDKREVVAWATWGHRPWLRRRRKRHCHRSGCAQQRQVATGGGLREFGCGGVVRFTQVVVMNVHGTDILDSAARQDLVKIKRDLQGAHPFGGA